MMSQNNGFEIMPYDDTYRETFEYNGLEQGIWSTEDTQKAIGKYSEYGPTFMAVSNGKMIAAAGIYWISTGVGQAWMFFNLEAAKYRKSIIKEIKAQIKEIAQANGYWRVQTCCPACSRIAIRFAENMGFQNEGTMKKCGPNKEDYTVHALLLEE